MPIQIETCQSDDLLRDVGQRDRDNPSWWQLVGRVRRMASQAGIEKII
jgi:hypothetical protein